MAETWKCETCDTEIYDRTAVINHLKEVHGETSSRPQGKREMVSHMDGATWYGGVDKWIMDCGAIIIESYHFTRKKDDPMRFDMDDENR